MSKVILITGGSTGIGAETARLLAQGNTILINYNSSKGEAEKVAEEVIKMGGKVYLLQQDISSEEGCIKLIEGVKEKVDRLDVLVNNAGGLIRRQNCRELQWDLMMETFALNTFAPMKLASLSIPLLEKGSDPVIINITSIVIRHGGPTATIYGAAKASLDTFTRGLARELAPVIRVNSVVPGVIDTPFHHKVSTPEQMENWRVTNPLKKNGKPQHIAMSIKYIIENDFLNGEAIDVNGGLYSR